MAFMAHQKEVAAAETSEAMERRFRPIAPKPLPASPPPMPIGTTVSSTLLGPHKRNRQDYLVPSPMSKRERDAMSYPPPPVWWATGDGEVPVVMRAWCMRESFLPGCEEHLRGLSLEGSSVSPWAPSPDAGQRLFPVERDLISKLQVPKVIKPRPARPVRTIICIDCSSIVVATTSAVEVAMSKKTPREVEVELELPDALPAIVSGCNNNRVYLANDAYKAMVGQPVCPWLDSLPGAGASRRINGEVVLSVGAFSTTSHLPSIRCAFPCTARISWEREDASASLTVPCAVERLTSNRDDYCFIWRFDSEKASIMYCIT
ncbi:hypothetical protein PAHAL_9G415600 [Panicum hallii]|jgi:hypothetical protein|uniref:DUF7950 domain-containing protein n=2 Tax=Panicum hallii TaxID=206008 RepID=A0A2S3IPH5_9POAL|nr:hypothetical protein PAHAL_9G415600 [Panicum hallii]